MSPRTRDNGSRGQKRKDILNAALRVFASRGLAGTRITDIADAAAISPGLIYHYFKDKDSVFADLVEMALESSLRSFTFAAGMGESPSVRLYFLLDSIFTYAYRGDGPLFFLIMIQAATFDPVPAEVHSLLAENSPAYGEALLPVIREGQATGEIRGNEPGEIFGIVTALIQGYAVLASNRLLTLDPAPADLLSAFFLTESGMEKVRAWQSGEGPAVAFSAFAAAMNA